MLLAWISIFSTSCALQNKSININEIKNGQTIITGKITITHHEYLSGKYLKNKTFSYKPLEIAIKNFDSIESVPKVMLSNAGVTRILANESSQFTYPIKPGKYYLIHLSSPGNRLIYFYTENYSEEAIEFNIIPNKVNYIGHIELNTFKEKYDDLNNDGLITKKEFKSQFKTYEEFYNENKSIWKAKDSLVNNIFTFGNRIQVKDEFDSYQEL